MERPQTIQQITYDLKRRLEFHLLKPRRGKREYALIAARRSDG